jgi:(R,R)-butanediol dehydrogenase / meso-butanediol dehydrogenase / diacetyl reductase
MLSVVYSGPDRLALEDRPRPVPGPDDALLRVSHVGVCGSDLLVWSGGIDRVRPPVALGHEFSGVVESAPSDSGLRDGDRVVVEPLVNCGTCTACRRGRYNRCSWLRLIGIDIDGAAAEYVAAPAHRCYRIPDRLGLREAVLAEPLAVAVHMVRRAAVGIGDRVGVLGGGTIGSLVAAVCQRAGVAQVTVVEPDDRRREVVARLGVATSASLPEAAPPDDEQFDVTFEASGAAAAMSDTTRVTRPGGTVLLGGLPSGPRSVDVPAAVFKELHLLGSRVYREADFAESIRLLGDGLVATEPLLTDESTLATAVDDAYGAMRAGRTLMKAFIRVGDEG